MKKEGTRQKKFLIIFQIMFYPEKIPFILRPFLGPFGVLTRDVGKREKATIKGPPKGIQMRLCAKNSLDKTGGSRHDYDQTGFLFFILISFIGQKKISRYTHIRISGEWRIFQRSKGAAPKRLGLISTVGIESLIAFKRAGANGNSGLFCVGGVPPY
ncbi:MAG: hypothetical protein CM15mP14_0520 [Rhodospirillaceae bacterium]|nr:MAG: hypothetical protein CM15mP14_0520 [Rhodospirillaceae bacterium]